MLFQVLCTSLFVEVISLAVNDDYKRHVFHIKLAECFCSKVFVSDKLCFFDAFCKKCTCTADGSEIYAVIIFSLHLRLPEGGHLFRSFLCAYGHHGRCIGIHTAAGCRACGADDFTWLCRSRTYIVYGSVCRVKRNLFLLFARASHILL
mgnify:CR=1 FL=1